jgi:hypothetical protein
MISILTVLSTCIILFYSYFALAAWSLPGAVGYKGKPYGVRKVRIISGLMLLANVFILYCLWK